MSASRGDASGKVLVWDAPVRVFHWLMVLAFAGAWLTAESERWRLAHVTLGYTMVALTAFRLVWGVVGTRTARFASFVRGPRAVLRYLGSVLAGKPERHLGHNPGGALAIVALLVLAAATTATGWAAYEQLGGEWLQELHESAESAMLAVVAVHVAGVALSSWVHRENLVGAMISGRKPGRPGEGIRRAWSSIAAVLVVAVIGLWFWQWQGASTTPGHAVAGTPGVHAEREHD